MSHQDEGTFAHSMADLMAGVAVTFLLIASIFMVQAMAARTRERAAAQTNAKELKKIRTDDRDARALLENLEVEFGDDLALRGVLEANYDARVDPYLLTLTLDRNKFRFRSEECALEAGMSDASRGPVRHAIERICAVDGASRKLLSISMEGHTDKKPFFPADERCGARPSTCVAESSERCRRIGFENNVRLSGSRAQGVFFELRKTVGDGTPLADCLNRFFVVSGRGPVEASGDDEAGRERDRRVVLKVRVRAGGEIATDRDGGAP